MEAYFFERNGSVFVNIKTDASTSVDLVATATHMARFKDAWNEFIGPVEVKEKPKPAPKPKAKAKAKPKGK